MENLTGKISESLEGIANLNAVFSSKREILVKGTPKEDIKGQDILIKSRLSRFGQHVEILETRPYLVVRIRPHKTAATTFPLVPLSLFFLTGITTILTGALWEGIDWISDPLLILGNPLAILKAGLPFSLSLLAILVFHEFGHYFAARYHGVNVTLPHFIPAPPGITLIGTFGAFIKSKSAFINKKQLLDVGAAGPLAGLVVAIFVIIIGLKSSTIQPMTKDISGIFFGESLLFKILSYFAIGPVGENQVLIISSVGFAGWVGLLVTMFNLLPLGQLDGGHIMYALFGKRQNSLTIPVIAGLVILSFYWAGWAVWLFMGILMRFKHPPTVMDEIPLGKGRRITGILSIIVFILCFIPEPISINL